MEVLEKRVRALKDGYRQNIAIIGDELVGKTTLIFKFLDKFYDNRIILLYLETRPETLYSFSCRFFGVLLYNFLSNSGSELKEDLDFLMGKASKYAPQTTEKMKSILLDLKKRKRDNILTELFSLCELIHCETGKFCVVILDEFQNLKNLGIKNLYAEWSKLLILQKNTMYIIISSFKFKTQGILAKDLNLLFGNFELITVEPFDIKTTEDYIELSLPWVTCNIGLRNFIVHFTGGYPFYLEVVCQSLLKANQASLVDILEDLFFASSGILNQRFTNYLKRFQDSQYVNDYISILYLISSGQNRIKDFAGILHKTKKDLSLRINHLLELDAVSRSGDFLKINDRVFGFWLKFVYSEKIHSLTFDAKNQRLLFRKNLEKMVQEFFIAANKPIAERIMDLLRLFDDDTIQIEKKNLRLNHFREIKSLEFNKRNFKDGLLCRSQESLWIMAFKYDLLTEEDIADFLKECKKFRSKTQRKIIIAFKDIDSNSRLRALEEKIWTWDLNNLNQILDLFSRPRIVL